MEIGQSRQLSRIFFFSQKDPIQPVECQVEVVVGGKNKALYPPSKAISTAIAFVPTMIEVLHNASSIHVRSSEHIHL